MNDLILNNTVLIVKQDMICQVISDMVRSIVREEVTILREEVTIVREEMTILREEIRSELQSFYERISTLIESSSAHRTLGPFSPPPPPFPLPPKVGKDTDLAPSPSSPEPPASLPPPETGKNADPAPGHSSLAQPTSSPPPEAGKDADPAPNPPSPPSAGTAQIIVHTHTPADDPSVDMV